MKKTAEQEHAEFLARAIQFEKTYSKHTPQSLVHAMCISYYAVLATSGSATATWANMKSKALLKAA
jgi:hypothetical protein